MTRMRLRWWSAVGLVLAGGCASPKVTHQRGWIGGEYVQARPASWLAPIPPVGATVHAFPDELRSNYAAGVLVSTVFSNTPAARAGLRPGDLILKIDDRLTPTLQHLRAAVETTPPGAESRFAVYRAGQLEEHRVRVGRESYEDWKSFAISLGLNSNVEFDAVPNPDFSLGVLGYRRYRDRLELHSPEKEFAREHRTATAKTDLQATEGIEGWHAWLTFFNFKGYRRILSQEAWADGAGGASGSASP